MPRKRPRNPSNPYGLEDRRWRFCQELLIDDNAAQAAIRAGYSEKTAKQQACRLLTNADVRRAVADLRAARAQRLETTADRVLQELAMVAFADIGQVMDFTGADVKLRPANAIQEQARRALASMKVKRYVEGHGDDARDVEVIEFKFWDKVTALLKLGQHLGLFTTKVEHGGMDGEVIPIQIVGIEIAEPGPCALCVERGSEIPSGGSQ
jgi:phage terminase small subunit